MRRPRERRKSERRVRSLDGVRGLAILLVFGFHCLNGPIQPHTALGKVLHAFLAMGWTGVDLFFVLSGYLITKSLWNGRDATNYYQVFYGRRAIRIFPLYYAVLIAVLLFAWIKHQPYSLPVQLLFLLNLSNLATAFNPALIYSLSFFWSLAVEEQFYFIWPTVLRHIQSRYLIHVLSAAILIPLLLRNLWFIPRLVIRWPDLVYRLTIFRIDTLAAGALLAVIALKYPEWLKGRMKLRLLFIGSGLIYLLLCHSKLPSNPNVTRFGYTLLVLCFTSLVALTHAGQGMTSRLFSNRFLAKMGDYSYCFYMLHIFPVIYLLQRPWINVAVQSRMPFPITANMAAAILGTTEFAITLALCALSYRYIEQPLFTLKKYFVYRYADKAPNANSNLVTVREGISA